MRVGPLLLAVLIMAVVLVGTSCAAEPVAETPNNVPPTSDTALANQVPSTTAEVVPSPPLTTYITFRPDLLAGGMLTLGGAQAQVRTFLGESTAVLEGYFLDEALPGVGSGGKPVVSLSNRKVFVIQRRIPGAALPDEFTVDASTGEVVEALLHSHGIHTGALRRIGEAEAMATAEEFGRTHFGGFDQLSLHQAAVSGVARDGVPIYVATWGRQAESGAWLPSSLRISVDLQTGQVVTYSVVRVDYRGPTVPIVGRERAVELALAEARQDNRLAMAKAGRVELMTWHVALGEWRLAWSVSLDGVPPGVMARQLFVDALTGAVLNPLGSPLG